MEKAPSNLARLLKREVENSWAIIKEEGQLGFFLEKNLLQKDNTSLDRGGKNLAVDDALAEVRHDWERVKGVCRRSCLSITKNWLVGRTTFGKLLSRRVTTSGLHNRSTSRRIVSLWSQLGNYL